MSEPIIQTHPWAAPHATLLAHIAELEHQLAEERARTDLTAGTILGHIEHPAKRAHLQTLCTMIKYAKVRDEWLHLPRNELLERRIAEEAHRQAEYIELDPPTPPLSPLPMSHDRPGDNEMPPPAPRKKRRKEPIN